MQRKTLIMLLLVGAVAAAYGQMARHDFLLWDDPGTVAGNPRLNPPTWSGVMHYWRHPEQGLYIPVTYSAWSILAAAAQLDQPDDRGIRLNPAIFHLANIAVHAATAVGVFLILRQLLSHDWAAASGALLYALHPVQVEAVAWISGLKDVLSGMFAMLALWQYLLFARGDQQHRRRWIHYSLATAALALAMLSKPSAMIVPLMALIIDALVIRRPIKRIALSLGPWFVLAAATALVAKLVQPAIGVPHTPLWARPLIAGDALSFYLYKLIFPLHLAIDYGRRPDVAMQSPAFYLAWIVPVLLGVLLLLFRRRAPMLIVAGCLFVAGVLPMLGWTRFLFQMYSTTADHYLYLAMLGPALALAWIIQRWHRPAVHLLAALLLVVLGIRTMAQGRHWANDYPLFSHALRVNPQSFAALTNLGSAYYADGRLEEAERHFRAAIALREDLVHARENLANVLALQGRVDEAIEQIRAALRIRESQPPDVAGDFSDTYFHVAQLLIRRGRYQEAIDELDRLLRQQPDHAEAQEARALAQQRLESGAKLSAKSLPGAT